MAEAGAAPYEVPPAWNVVLDAWNDPSLGVGLVAVTAGDADGEEGRNGQSGVGAGSGHGGVDEIKGDGQSTEVATESAGSVNTVQTTLTEWLRRGCMSLG